MALTKLEVINYALIFAGEAPVNSLTGKDQGVDTSTVNFLLDRVIEEWQERGIDNNTFTTHFTPDPITGEIVLPLNTIDAYSRMVLFNLDTENNPGNFVQTLVRDGKLYNNTNLTYNWLFPYNYAENMENGQFLITIKQEIPWEELDQNGQRSIMHEVARRYQLATQNDPQIAASLTKESQYNRARGRANDMLNKDRNLFKNGDRTRMQAVDRRFGWGNNSYWVRSGYTSWGLW